MESDNILILVKSRYLKSWTVLHCTQCSQTSPRHFYYFVFPHINRVKPSLNLRLDEQQNLNEAEGRPGVYNLFFGPAPPSGFGFRGGETATAEPGPAGPHAGVRLCPDGGPSGRSGRRRQPGTRAAGNDQRLEDDLVPTRSCKMEKRSCWFGGSTKRWRLRNYLRTSADPPGMGTLSCLVIVTLGRPLLCSKLSPQRKTSDNSGRWCLKPLMFFPGHGSRV